MEKKIKFPKFETVEGRKAQVKIEQISTYDYKVKATKYFADTDNAYTYIDSIEQIEGMIKLYYFREYYRNGRKWIENI